MQVHIGEKIKNRAKEIRLGSTQLAAKINTSKQNVYGIYRRRSIDTELLYKISEALEFDFFSYYRPKVKKVANDSQGEYIAKSELEALWEKVRELETTIKRIESGT